MCSGRKVTIGGEVRKKIHKETPIGLVEIPHWKIDKYSKMSIIDLKKEFKRQSKDMIDPDLYAYLRYKQLI